MALEHFAPRILVKKLQMRSMRGAARPTHNTRLKPPNDVRLESRYELIATELQTTRRRSEEMLLGRGAVSGRGKMTQDDWNVKLGARLNGRKKRREPREKRSAIGIETERGLGIGTETETSATATVIVTEIMIAFERTDIGDVEIPLDDHQFPREIGMRSQNLQRRKSQDWRRKPKKKLWMIF